MHDVNVSSGRQKWGEILAMRTHFGRVFLVLNNEEYAEVWKQKYGNRNPETQVLK